MSQRSRNESQPPKHRHAESEMSEHTDFESKHRETISLLRELSGPFGSAWATFARILLGAKSLSEADQAKILQDRLEAGSINMKDIEFDSGILDEDVASKCLKEWLLACGVSQVELARRLEVSPPVVSRIIRHPLNARVQTWRRIADALGIADFRRLFTRPMNADRSANESRPNCDASAVGSSQSEFCNT